MDQLVQCPVCTLYLHNGMSLESHLDTHPKDQVIKALCSLSANRPYGSTSRSTTPMNSERSFRSRSRTPATEESNAKWSNGHTPSEHDHYWRRTPSRTPKSSTVTRSNTPDVRAMDGSTDSISIANSTPVYSHGTYPPRLDKFVPAYEVNVTTGDCEQPYQYLHDQREEEIKYSRSAEYNSLHNTNNVYAYNMAPVSSCMKLLPSPIKRSEVMTNMLPHKKQGGDFLKILPKPAKTKNIALLKTGNMGSVQYLAPAVMVSSATTYSMQNNSPSSLIMTANIQNSTPLLQSKSISTPLSTNQYSQINTGTFAPNTTVVTKNSHSQIIYSEMVQNVDSKRYLPNCVPTVLGTQESVTNVAQTSALYQNVVVLDQFGNTSCMYTPQILPKPTTSMYNQIPANIIDNKIPGDSNKTLIIEVSPIESPTPTETHKESFQPPAPKPELNLESRNDRRIPEKPESLREMSDTSGPTKGLKILSNIKVEVPVQHHKNLLNTIVDLTVPTESDYANRCKSPDHILPDIEDNQDSKAQGQVQPSVSISSVDVSVVSNTFSVIKNVGNPPSYKESKQPEKIHENESSDSCPVPDLICNEKPSISPCSELSDNCDNATAHPPLLPKIESNDVTLEIKDIKKETIVPVRNYRSNPLRLNNIYVKKNKKVLQIKNAKSFPVASTSSSSSDRAGPSRVSPRASPRTSPRPPEDFTVTKIHAEKPNSDERTGRLETVSINKITDKEKVQNDFDADTEEQSMDMELEPTADSSYGLSTTIDLTRVKDEANSSNDTGISEREFTELESLRPINVVQPYGNMGHDFDDESNHRELLDLEAASKNKQFVSMMNDNYFGDNIYADYFTPDRVESFDTVREPSAYSKEVQKDGVYLWGESSQKESEFVLPNFIHESYRIAESHGSYALGAEVEAGDSKADVLSERSEGEPPLNICADERMPPRGELSGQESNGDMESSWTGMYPEVTAPEPYDLIARESWLSDASDMDSNDNNLVIDHPSAKPPGRQHACGACPQQFQHARELRAHRALAHAPAPSPAPADATYARIIAARPIKKEEKPDEAILTGMLQDSKAGIASAVLEVYEALQDSKPPLKVIKQENKRKKRDYICPTCKVDQVTDVAFHEHLKIHPLECLTCGKCFFRRANLALHIKTHLGIKNYKCEVCEKRFMTRQRLLEHHNIHTGRAPFKCSLCEQSFRRYSNMVQHRDRHHFHKKPKVRDYVCHCGEVYHSRAKLRWHAETHDGKPKACQYCSDKFVHLSSLTRHVRRTHNATYTRDDCKRKCENVTCPICKQVYLRTNLKTHMRTHSGKRPHVCMICNKAFTTQWNLKLHRWTHMGRSAKPFKCGLCKGAFIRQSEYISHMNAHKSVRPYTCNYCGCQFIRKYNCQRHVREHEMAKKYVCKVPDCGKTFHRSYYLSEHMKVHSGARPFTCNICGKTSSHKSNHNKHVRIHHAREPVATEA